MNILCKEQKEISLTNFETQVSNGTPTVRWRCVGSCTHFLIIVSDALSNCSSDEMLAGLSEIYNVDTDLKNGEYVRILKNEEKFAEGLVLSYEQYLREMNKSGWKYLQQNPSKRIPLKVSVFPCNFGEGEFTVFKIKDAKNDTYLPITVRYFQERCGFGKKQVNLKIERVTNYPDGAFGYRIPNFAIDIPITAEALDRELTIEVQGKEELIVYVDKNYSNYYKLLELTRC